MSAARLIANSLRIAREDLAGARTLHAAGNRNAVYLCQQAAEKIILAVLTSEGKHGGIRHHLEAMVDLVPDANPIKPHLRAIEDLAAFATTYRYPTSAGRVLDAPSTGDMASWLENVAAALDLASRRFHVDLDAEGPAQKPEPIR